MVMALIFARDFPCVVYCGSIVMISWFSLISLLFGCSPPLLSIGQDLLTQRTPNSLCHGWSSSCLVLWDNTMVVLSRNNNPFHEFGSAIWLLGLVLPQKRKNVAIQLVDSPRWFALGQLEHLITMPISAKKKKKGRKGHSTGITTHTCLMHFLLGQRVPKLTSTKKGRVQQQRNPSHPPTIQTLPPSSVIYINGGCAQAELG